MACFAEPGGARLGILSRPLPVPVPVVNSCASVAIEVVFRGVAEAAVGAAPVLEGGAVAALGAAPVGNRR